MRAAAFAAVAVLLLGALGIWLQNTADDASPEPARNSPAPTPPTVAVAHDERAGAPRDAEPDAMRSRATAIGSGATVRIVVDDVAGMPVVGARVCYWPPRSPAARAADHARRNAGEALEAVLKATGAEAATGEDGSVAIVVDPGSDGCVRGDGTYAAFDMRHRPLADTSDERVTLRRDVTLRVEVVDSLGRPAPDCRIDVRSQGVARTGGSSWTLARIGTTDAAGRATLPHALHELDLDERVADSVVSIGVYRQGRNANVFELARRHVAVGTLVAETTVQLTIPAGGTIVTRAVDAGGAAAARFLHLLDEHGETFDAEPAWHDSMVPPRSVRTPLDGRGRQQGHERRRHRRHPHARHGSAHGR